MKKILCIAALSVCFLLTALADGDMGSGTKTCTSNCGNFHETTIETTIKPEETKTLIETTNDFFNKISDYFIELTF